MKNLKTLLDTQHLNTINHAQDIQGQNDKGGSMKVLVAVKRVVDYNVKIRVKADGSGVETDNVKMSMNPFDEVAVEEALRLREAGAVEEVILASIGSEDAQATLRTGLAMGADRGVHVLTPTSEPLSVAKALKVIAQNEDASLVLLGKQAIDDDACQSAQMLAALLGWGQGTFVSSIKLEGNALDCVREVDGGLTTINLSLPAVLSVDLRLNEPRYASLPNIMKAKQKPIQTLSPEDIGVDFAPRLKTLQVSEPEERAGGVKVPDVQTLVDKLRNEAKVI